MNSREPEHDNLGRLLRASRDRLQASGIPDASIEAELLLRHALRRPGAPLPSKSWLLPRLGQLTTEQVRTDMDALVRRRLAREPSAYITGIREFCALDFEVTPDVLIPRPETELLVAKAVEWAYGRSPRPSPFPGPDVATQRRIRQSHRTKHDPITIVDVGTGSGAVAVALARDLPVAGIVATDVSWPALAVARRNAARHGLERRIDIRHGDLLLPLDGYVDLIVANLPYVTDAGWRGLQPEVRDHEPALALRGGQDGLDLIRALLHQAPRYLRSSGTLFLEFGAGQQHAVVESVARLVPGASVSVYNDFAGIPRVLAVSTPA